MFEKIRSLIFKFDPEKAHDLAIHALKTNIVPIKIKNYQSLKVKFLEKEISNPIGIAAGFDKNAEVYNSLFKLGFGFVEVGTITPEPQYGNPKPRVFRLEEDEALINRLGFNNVGSEKASENINKNLPNGLLGINIGPNKDTKNRLEDYLKCFRIFNNLSDYITINISSPNTEGLRDLQKKGNIENLLETITKCNKKNLPTFIKISPDIDDNNLKNICKICIKEDSISGLVISNTTISRESLHSKQIRNSWKILEKGGLSGPPLMAPSTKVLADFYRLTEGKVPLIGVGGIASGKDAYEKILNGASLVQLYSSLVYHGLELVTEIKEDLARRLRKDGFANVSDAVGAAFPEISGKGIPVDEARDAKAALEAKTDAKSGNKEDEKD